jgi:hypothetical protein
LSLFKPWILFVNHIQFALASDDLTISAAFLYGCFNFHLLFVLCDASVVSLPSVLFAGHKRCVPTICI